MGRENNGPGEKPTNITQVRSRGRNQATTVESEFSHQAVITVLKESTCFFSNQINWQRQLILSWVNGWSIHTVLINAFSYARSNCLPTLRLLCTVMEIGIKAFCLIVYQQRFQLVSEIQT